MLCHVALVRTDVSEARTTSIIRVTRIGSMLQLLVTVNVVSSLPILVTLMMMVAIHSSKISVLTRATLCNIPESGIFHVITCLPVCSGGLEQLYNNILNNVFAFNFQLMYLLILNTETLLFITFNLAYNFDCLSV
jgi:hypothetical protein